MRLIGKTSDSSGDFVACHLDLTPESVEWLFARKNMVAAVMQDPSFYAVEFFDGAAVYGAADVDNLVEWEALPDEIDDPVVDGQSAARTVVVTAEGVLWSASPKHGDGYFETELVSWEQLEAVRRGENPFPTYAGGD